MDSQDNKRKWKNRDLISSLEFAITGIFTAIKEERNMRKHAVTALVVILAGFVFQVSRIEWLFLLLSIFLVVAFEIINSAIRSLNRCIDFSPTNLGFIILNSKRKL